MKFRRLYRKSDKNMMSVAMQEYDVRFCSRSSYSTYPKSILPQQQFLKYVSLLFHSVSDAACYSFVSAVPD